MSDDARILINADGTWEDANEAALITLGVESIEQLRSMPSGAFSASASSPEEGAAFRIAWSEQGSGPIVGETSLRRANGEIVPVKFLIALQSDGRYLAVLRPLTGPAGETTMFVSAGQALSAWRAAERRLEALGRDDPQWAAANDEVERFRSEYRRLFEQARGGQAAR